MVHGFSALEFDQLSLISGGSSLMAMAYFADPKSFGQIWKDKQSLVMIFVFALFGLFPNQFAYLEAIHETNAGTATLYLQYLCPVGILAYTCIKDKVAPTVSEVCSMFLAIGGTFLIATTHGPAQSAFL